MKRVYIRIPTTHVPAVVDGRGKLPIFIDDISFLSPLTQIFYRSAGGPLLSKYFVHTHQLFPGQTLHPAKRFASLGRGFGDKNMNTSESRESVVDAFGALKHIFPNGHNPLRSKQSTYHGKQSSAVLLTQ